MADEAQTGATPEEQQTGGATAIDALFDGKAPAPPPESTGGAPADPPEQFQVGRVPKPFYREDGNHDYDGLSKSWFDTRDSYERAKTRISELEKAAAEGVPEAFEAYAAGMDWAAVKERAPNAYVSDEEENAAATALLRRAHQHGIPLAKARAMIGDYYEDLNGMVGAPKDAAEVRRDVLQYLGPNGQQQLSEVQEFLKSRAAVKPFNAEEMDVIGQMLSSGVATSLLWQLSRSGASTMPPGNGMVDTGTRVDPEREKQEAAKMLGTLDPQEWQKNKAEAIARWQRANPEAA